MTQRERKLLTGVGGAAALLAVVLLFARLVLEPLSERDKEIANLREEIDSKQRDLRKKKREQRELMRLRAMSLPANPNPRGREADLAWNEYDKYLRELMRSSRLKGVRITGTPPVERGPATPRTKKPLFVPLSYTVEATGQLTSLVAMLKRFYETPLLHQVKTLTIKPVRKEAGPGKRPSSSSDRELSLKMTVEALLVEGAEKRSYLLPADRRLLAVNGLLGLRRAPVGLPLIPWVIDPTGLLRPRPLTPPTTPGEYAYIARKNVFFEPTPPEKKAPPKKREYPDVNINEHTRLTSIIRKGARWEAFFYNVFLDVNTRVRATDERVLWARRQVPVKAFQNIPIWDSDGDKQSARVVRMDLEKVYFAYEGSYYAIIVGETLADAFDNKPLKEKQVKELGLPEEPEPEPDKDKETD